MKRERSRIKVSETKFNTINNKQNVHTIRNLMNDDDDDNTSFINS